MPTFIDRIFGREEAAPEPEDVIEKAAPPTTSIGNTGVLDMGGWVVSGETNYIMAGPQRWAQFDRMVRDVSIIAAAVRAYLNLISNAEWTVNPPEDQKDNPQAQEIADTCYDILFDMKSSWSTVVRKQAMFRFSGAALQEWTAKRREDGAIGLLDIENRPIPTINRWNRDGTGTIESVTQRTNNGGEVTIPRSKLVYAVDDTFTEQPEGMGLLRHCVDTAHRLEQFLKLERIGFETDLRGIPVARAPLGELKAEVEKAGPVGSDAYNLQMAKRKKMLQPIYDFISTHIKSFSSGMVLPSEGQTGTNASGDGQTISSLRKWDIELLQGDSGSFSDMANAVTRMTQELARILGAEHLLLGADGSGSLALSQSKVGTFYLTITSTLTDLLEVFERDVIEHLGTMNGWPEELMPELGVAEIRDANVEAITTALAQMAQAGAVLAPDDPAIGEVRDMLGLSRPPEDGMALDASLTPARSEADIDVPLTNSDQLEKRWMKSRKATQRAALSKIRKRMREAA